MKLIVYYVIKNEFHHGDESCKLDFVEVEYVKFEMAWRVPVIQTITQLFHYLTTSYVCYF